MSSSYPSFGNAPARPCQRCGRPLPPNEVYCGNCGQYNAIQLNNSVAQPSSGPSWGVAPPQTSYSSDQNEGFQWGQPPVQAPQNNPISGYSVPQQPFGPSSQPLSAGNFYGASAQQSNTDNFYEAPGQPARLSNFYSAPQAPFSPQQAPFGPQPSSQPMTTGFQPGTMSGYQFAGFPQAPAQVTTRGSQPGMMNGYQPGDFFQPPQRKSGPRVALIIGVVVLLVVITGGGVLGYFSLIKSQGSATTQTTLTPTPTPVPNGKPLFNDAFTNNKNAWDTTSRAGQFSVKIGNGSLVLEDDNNKLLWELVPGGRSFRDFFLTTDVVLSKGTPDNGYGIYIRSASNLNVDIATYYRFELYGDGTFAIYKGTVDANGTSKSNFLVNYTTSSAILKQGQVNHIAVGAKGSSMTFIVNGQTLKTISDNSYASGSVAMFVSNLPNTTPGAQATFSNFVIYPPQT